MTDPVTDTPLPTAHQNGGFWQQARDALVAGMRDGSITVEPGAMVESLAAAGLEAAPATNGNCNIYGPDAMVAEMDAARMAREHRLINRAEWNLRVSEMGSAGVAAAHSMVDYGAVHVNELRPICGAALNDIVVDDVQDMAAVPIPLDVSLPSSNWIEGERYSISLADLADSSTLLVGRESAVLQEGDVQITSGILVDRTGNPITYTDAIRHFAVWVEMGGYQNRPQPVIGTAAISDFWHHLAAGHTFDISFTYILRAYVANFNALFETIEDSVLLAMQYAVEVKVYFMEQQTQTTDLNGRHGDNAYALLLDLASLLSQWTGLPVAEEFSDGNGGRSFVRSSQVAPDTPTSQPEEQTTLFNSIFDRLINADPAANRAAVDAINDFTRLQIRQDGMWRHMLPPVPVTNDDLDRHAAIEAGRRVAALEQAEQQQLADRHIGPIRSALENDEPPTAEFRSSWTLWSDNLHAFMCFEASSSGIDVIVGNAVPKLRFPSRIAAEQFRSDLTEKFGLAAVQVRDPWYEIEAVTGPPIHGNLGYLPDMPLRLLRMEHKLMTWAFERHLNNWGIRPRFAVSDEDTAETICTIAVLGGMQHVVLNQGGEARPINIAQVKELHCQSSQFRRPLAPVTVTAHERQQRAIEMRE